MRAVRYHERGDLSVLNVEDRPVPAPDHGTVRVAVVAIGVNPIDAQIRNGTVSGDKLPTIPGSDFAGVVDAVGSGVSRFDIGDRIFGTGMDTDPRGTYTEYAVVPTDQCYHLPAGTTFQTGAAIAHVGVTAWRALFDHASLSPGHTCLIHGGSGGVGHVAVQLAAAAGVEVIATAGRDSARERVRELGATHVFDYERDDLRTAINERVPGGVDVVLDHMTDRYLDLDIAVTSFDADIVCLGGPSGKISDGQDARDRDVSLHFVSMYNTPDISRVLEPLADLLESGRLSVDIAHLFALEEAATAQRTVVEDSFVGKVVLHV
ncbi:quinone oxidoreductase family protein [Haloarcula sp. GH36]|uniref:quinone oxidoreductase family protein n=1 Tax=Haloarcula montana TaxID=3111776 RepID=UPI002D7883A5|nr:NADPH:quinone reductase [Haloarcula sp. GH36]